jgi:hypothetical protein
MLGAGLASSSIKKSIFPYMRKIPRSTCCGKIQHASEFIPAACVAGGRAIPPNVLIYTWMTSIPSVLGASNK